MKRSPRCLGQQSLRVARQPVGGARRGRADSSMDTTTPSRPFRWVERPAAANGDNDMVVEECDLEDESSLEACLDRQGYYDSTLTTAQNPSMMTKIYTAQLEKLQTRFPSQNIPNRRQQVKTRNSGSSNAGTTTTVDDDVTTSSSATSTSSYHRLQYTSYWTDDDIVLVDVVRRKRAASNTMISRAFVRAGPRETLHFVPSTTRAAIVTCGGLCPGLNTVVRELTHALYRMYGVPAVYGIRGGYHGFRRKEKENGDDTKTSPSSSSWPGPVLLTMEMVENVHHDGGTFLKTSRGGFDIQAIMDFIQSHDIQQLYIVGGDGTHRGAYNIHQECVRQNVNVAIAGIPKTIDNDVDYIDRSFGFLSAVEAAQASIRYVFCGQVLFLS
jgi:6-phosphofructokinase 1